MKTRSRDILEGPQWANVRALYKADGYAEEELKRPLIGVVNSYSTICPGHRIFRQLSECHASNYSSCLLQLCRRLNSLSPSYRLS